MTPVIAPNFDGRFHYGVIQQNSLDPEVLNRILQEGTSEYQRYLQEKVGEALDILEGLLDDNDVDAVRDLIDELVSDADSDDDSPVHFEDVEGVSGIWFRNNFTLMITHSDYRTCCRQCSPCYPNAGDLDTPDEYGFDTYAPPADWWDDYVENKPKVSKISEEELK